MPTMTKKQFVKASVEWQLGYVAGQRCAALELDNKMAVLSRQVNAIAARLLVQADALEVVIK